VGCRKHTHRYHYNLTLYKHCLYNVKKNQNSGPTLYSGGHCYDCPHQIRNRVQWSPSWTASDRQHTGSSDDHSTTDITATCTRDKFLLINLNQSTMNSSDSFERLPDIRHVNKGFMFLKYRKSRHDSNKSIKKIPKATVCYPQKQCAWWDEPLKSYGDTHLDTLKNFSIYFSKLATLTEKISVSDFQTNLQILTLGISSVCPQRVFSLQRVSGLCNILLK
jgi:hypothetical protein